MTVGAVQIRKGLSKSEEKPADEKPGSRKRCPEKKLRGKPENTFPVWLPGAAFSRQQALRNLAEKSWSGRSYKGSGKDGGRDHQGNAVKRFHQWVHLQVGL